jgi:hypothetical protein
VALIAATTNFMNPDLPIVPGLPLGWGAWVVLLIIPSFIWLFKLINRHYAQAALISALPGDPADLHPLHHQVVVPIARLNLPTVRAVQYAASISPNAVCCRERRCGCRR